MLKNYKNIIGVFFLLGLCSCASFFDSSEARYSGGSKLIPLRALYAIYSGGENFKISTDGKRLAWTGRSDGKKAFFVKNLITNKVRPYELDVFDDFFFVGEGQYIAIPYFDSASKKYSINLLDLDAKSPSFKEVLPELPGHISIIENSFPASDNILVRHQDADSDAEYILMNFRTYEFRYAPINAKNVTTVRFSDGNVNVLMRHDEDVRFIERLDATSEQYQAIYTCSNPLATLFLLGVEKDSTVNFVSNCHGNFHEVKSIDINGNIKTRSCDDGCVVDLDQAFSNPVTGKPAFGIYHKETFIIENFGDVNYSDMPFFKSLSGHVSVSGTSDDFSTWIVKNSSSLGDVYYLFKPETGYVERVSAEPDKRYQSKVISPEWVELPAGGVTPTYAYYYPPQGEPVVGAPAVILIHGGPHSRSYPNYNTDALLLANRGYQVLDINYRGSIGFGLDYQNAGKKNIEVMLEDIASGAKWLEFEPRSAKSIAVMGSSFGGYLSVLASYHHDYKCGVSINGLYDLQRTAMNFPTQGENSFLYQYFSEDFSKINSQFEDFSPSELNDFEGKNLLLAHGRYDGRISIDTAKSFYEKNRLNNDITFVPFNDGHNFNKWYTAMQVYREAEKFLAECLGGRDAGFDYYFLAKPFYEFKDRK